MLRAQKLAIAFEGDEASGWRASIIGTVEEPRGERMVGSGSSRAEAAEDAWNRHAAPRD